jgi:hypothetical protein
MIASSQKEWNLPYYHPYNSRLRILKARISQKIWHTSPNSSSNKTYPYSTLLNGQTSGPKTAKQHKHQQAHQKQCQD